MLSNSELENILNAKIKRVETIREKDGVIVVRVYYGDMTCIVKYFENREYTREVNMYKLVNSLGIKTLKIYYFGDNFMIMEDLNKCKDYSLAVETDLQDLAVLKNLAVWYRELHTKGKTCDLSNLYDENDVITIDNIKSLGGLIDESSVKFLLNNYDNFIKLKNKLPYTLTYNDFACENLIVGKDVAFMYDYNFVGKGTAYSDVQNVMSMLDDDKKQIFFDYYGRDNIQEIEVVASKILQTISSLIRASKRERFPRWAECLLSKVQSSEFKFYISCEMTKYL